VIGLQKKGISLGWYGNNCPETSGTGRGPKFCGEHGKLEPDWDAALKGDVAALIEFNFSSIKLDNPNCGAGSDMQSYYDLVNRTSPRPIVIENCHYNTTFPRWLDGPGSELVCPMSMYRVSGDIKSNWATIMRNAQATIPYADQSHPMSRPGCWAYPDMLEVGVIGQNGQSEGGLTFAEQRTHFGIWAVISSPLTLSFDLGNQTLVDLVWPIISNTEVLAISQSYYGHPGTLTAEDKDTAGQMWQVWSKPQAYGAVAVLLISQPGVTRGMRHMNMNSTGALDLSLTVSDFVAVPTVAVRDLWNHKDLGIYSSTDTISFPAVEMHDSIFLLLQPACSKQD